MLSPELSCSGVSMNVMRKAVRVRAATAIGAPWFCALVATLFVALSGGAVTPSASAAL